MRACGSEAGCRRARPVRHQESWRRYRAITQPRECTTVLNYVGHARVGPENLSLVLRRMPVSERQYGHASSESCEYPSHVAQVDSDGLQEETYRVLDPKPRTFEARMVLCCLTSRGREEPSLLKFRRLGHREGEIRDLITARQFGTRGLPHLLREGTLFLPFPLAFQIRGMVEDVQYALFSVQQKMIGQIGCPRDAQSGNLDQTLRRKYLFQANAGVR